MGGVMRGHSVRRGLLLSILLLGSSIFLWPIWRLVVAAYGGQDRRARSHAERRQPGDIRRLHRHMDDRDRRLWRVLPVGSGRWQCRYLLDEWSHVGVFLAPTVGADE